LLFKSAQHDIIVQSHQGNLPDGRKVAVKKLTQSSATDDGSEIFMREVKLMSDLKHENLAQLLFYCKEGNERILVYEYMENRSLNLYIFGTYCTYY
jgi:serine/threonine protein kinase